MSQKRGFGTSPVVPLTSDIHNHLRDNHAGQTEGVKLLDGVYYTANRDDQETWNPDNVNTWEKNPVYQYGSDRYVRVTPWAFGTDETTYKCNATADNPDPEQIGQVSVASGSASNYRWFKIEPIKWIVLNKYIISDTGKINTELNITTDLAGVPIVPQGATLELYAADALMSGIPYNLSAVAEWNSSRTMYRYLNNEFYSQAFSTDEIKFIQQSTIYNNTTDGELTKETGLNSNHLTDGSGQNGTIQKIYLLSWYELLNANSPYVENGIFDEGPGATSTRQVNGTDYARAHYLSLGLWEGKSYAYYLTRSIFNTHRITRVLHTGGRPATNSQNGASTNAFNGQRPALQLKLNCFVEPYNNKKVQSLSSNQTIKNKLYKTNYLSSTILRWIK